jgi:hypothetical protein
LVSIPPPDTGIYHLTRRSRLPFSPPPWEFVGHERFDDPLLSDHDESPPAGAFRVIYAATDRSAAIRESIAHFRPSIALLAALEHDVLNEQATALESLGGSYRLQDGRIRGIVPYGWLESRQIGHMHLERQHRFVDLTDTRSLSYLRTIPEITRLAVDNGIHEIDLSAITGDCRPFTQTCARHIHGLSNANGQPSYSGIRYVSRHGSHRTWECWAIFDERLIQHLPVNIQKLESGDSDVNDALKAFDLLIQDSTGNVNG